MKKSLSTLLTSALGLALLVYSGVRSWDFVSATLPPDKQILAVFALAATEFGVLFWLAYFLYSAKGGTQRAIALIMIVVDFLGSLALFTGDTLLRSGESGMIEALSKSTLYSIILAMSVIIGANVGATILTHLADPENRQRMAREEMQDEIEGLALKALQDSAPRLAAELAPQIAAQSLEELRAEYQNGLTRRQVAARNAAYAKSVSEPNKNGHKEEKIVLNAETVTTDLEARNPKNA